MFKENLEAIATLKRLQAENRKPNHSEQLILSKFNGWGAMWQVFKPEHPQHETLKSLLTPEEFTKANASVLNAYYTNTDIVKAVWECVKQLGFKSGKVLEPSCGIGYFLNERADNEWTAIELDPIPAAIAKYLHPTATIYNQGFERTSLPNGCFDLAIGNVPFGGYSVFEPGYDGLLIHNHFIAKCVDLTREGGLIALITSTGTLDAYGNEEFRESLSQKATLIAAIRMPSSTMSNAKTQVTTDLLIFKREPEPNAKWLETVEVLDLPMNQYFLDQPDHVLGEVCLDKLYGNERLAVKSDGRNLTDAIARVIKQLPPCYTEAEISYTKTRLIPSELQNLPVNAFCKLDGQLYQRAAESLEQIPWSHQIAKNLTILEIVNELLERQLHQTDEELASMRAKLNQEYDRYVEMCGYLSGDENKAKMQSDPRYGLLYSLDAEGKKAQIFTKRTTRGYRIPDQCATPKEALLHCLKVQGRVDLGWIAARVS
jgi:hypothetical protein